MFWVIVILVIGAIWFYSWKQGALEKEFERKEKEVLDYEKEFNSHPAYNKVKDMIAEMNTAKAMFEDKKRDVANNEYELEVTSDKEEIKDLKHFIKSDKESMANWKKEYLTIKRKLDSI